MQYWWRELLCLGSLSPGWSLAWPKVALTVKCSYFLSSISFVNDDTNLVTFSRQYSREANKKLQAHSSMDRTLKVRSLTPKYYCSWLKYPLLFLAYGLSKAKTAKWEVSATLRSTVGEIATKFSSNIRIKSLIFFWPAAQSKSELYAFMKTLAEQYAALMRIFCFKFLLLLSIYWSRNSLTESSEIIPRIQCCSKWKWVFPFQNGLAQLLVSFNIVWKINLNTCLTYSSFCSSSRNILLIAKHTLNDKIITWYFF